MTHPLHQKALKLSTQYLESERHLIDVLEEIDRLKIWRQLGHSSFFDYVKSGLGLSEGQAYTFTSVSKKCREIPGLKAAILAEEVSVSNAKRILPVLTLENQEDWIGKAQILSARKLEKEVAAINPRASVKEEIKPVAKNLSKMTLCISGETEVLFRRAQDVLSKKRKKNLSLEDTVLAMAAFVIQKLDKVEKAKRAERRCINKKERLGTQTSLCRDSGDQSLSQRRKAIPQKIQDTVQIRDRGECQAKLPDGSLCRKSRFTEIHHRVPVSEGGTDHVSNLTVLCSPHHKHQHDQVLAL